MENNFQALDAYDILNNLMPGAVLYGFAAVMKPPDFLTMAQFCNIAIEIIIAYVIGVITSRIGSIWLEPILRGFVSLDEYDQYCMAEKADSKICVLVRDMNCYRSLIVANLTIAIISVGCVLGEYNVELSVVFLGVSLISAFVLVQSYFKKVKQIHKRIKLNKEKNNAKNGNI